MLEIANLKRENGYPAHITVFFQKQDGEMIVPKDLLPYITNQNDMILATTPYHKDKN